MMQKTYSTDMICKYTSPLAAMTSLEQADNNRRFNLVAQDFNKLYDENAELKAHLQKEEQERQLKEIQHFRLQVLGLMYDKGHAYTNLVMAAGYAAYFVMWENTYTLLPQNLLRLSGALMLFSLTIFIGWEVYKMLYGHKVIDRLEILLSATVEDHDRKLEEFNFYTNNAKLRERRLWRWVNIFSVPTSFLALWIHICSFAYNKFW